MRKVCILAPAYPYRGGLASFSHMMAEGFQGKGIEVDIITFKLQYPQILFPGKTQYSQSAPPEGLRIERMVNSCNPFNWVSTARYINRKGYDALVMKYWTPFMAPCLGSIAKFTNKQTIKLAALDNIIPHEPHFYDRMLNKYFIKQMDGFLYMSEQVREELEEFGKGFKTVFAPHPVFENFGEAVSKEEAARVLQLDLSRKYILFFGLIRDYKGLDLLIKAFDGLRKSEEFKKHKLLIAGECYSKVERYTALINYLGMEDAVVFHNRFIKDEEVKYYFSIADMVVQPYKTATQSGVTQIAYKMNTPMVVTNVGGLPEIVPHDKVGRTCDPKPEAITEAIRECYKGNRLQTYRDNMVVEKERFTWGHFTEQLEELYRKVKG